MPNIKHIRGGEMILPNVRYCEDNNEVHYNPIVPPSRVITAVFNIPTTANPISLTYENGWNNYESILVTRPNGTTFELSYSDLVQYDSISEYGDPFYGYQFDTVGNYTFEYTLKPNVDTIYGEFTSIPYITSVEIPNIVTTIASNAFSGCTGLTSVTIPNSVTTIEDLAFGWCTNLTNINIPDSVTTISDAFLGCTSLPVENNIRYADTYAVETTDKTLSIYTIKQGTRFISSSVFSNCTNLTTITIPSTVISVDYGPFSKCNSLIGVTVDSNNSIYDSRNNCNAIIETSTNTLIGGCKNTVIPNTVTSIGDSAFSSCSGLTSITIPNSVTSISNNAFEKCSGLTSITIPSSVTSIGDNAFINCSGLTSVIIPDSVTNIGNSAFYHCENITSITIGSGVTSIGSSAFVCRADSVTITATIPPTINGNFAYYITRIDGGSIYIRQVSVIYVPSESLSTYQAASGWNSYTIQAIPTT